MQCPKCHHMNLKVIDSRSAEDNHSIRRRRKCIDCGHRFTTFERIEQRPLLVIKRDGNRQEFSRDKLLRGLVRSCEKRPVSLEQLERVVADIELQLRESGKNEIPSTDIGELVMDRLPQIDEVAYIRYASVYRRFEDPAVFLKEIERLKARQEEADSKENR